MAQQDEGIMSLMGAQQGMGATPEDPQVDMYEFRKQAYPVVKDSIREVSPEAYGEMQATLSSELAGAGDMDPEAIEQLLEIVDYINENPNEYAKIREALISGGVIEKDDFPEQMDVEYFATMEVVLQEALSKARGEQGQMVQGPTALMPPQGFAKGGIAEAAQLVASRGRYGDTMLAHITPSEARLLKARGGSGTINPETGLPEFFLKKLGKSISKAVKSVVKTVTNVVKKVVASPIGRIVATVGLTMLGVPPPLASALVTKAAGGTWKDALKSAAVSYLAGPTSPIASTVSKFTPFLDSAVKAGTISSAVSTGIRSGLTATGASLLTGSSLKEAVTSGVTSGLMAGVQEARNPAPTPETAIDTATADAAGGRAPTESGGASASPTVRTGEGFLDSAGPGTFPQAPVPSPTGEGFLDGAGPGTFNRLTGNATFEAPPPPTPPASFMDKAKDLYNRTFSSPDAAAEGTGAQGEQSLWEKTKEFMYPSKPTDVQIADQANKIVEASGGRISYDKAWQSATDQLTPGVVAQYGPAIAGGLGAVALAGGFSPKEDPESPLAQKIQAPIELGPVFDKPMQNLPGVIYDEQGNIIGSKPWNPGAGSSRGDIEVATPGIMSLSVPPTYQPPPLSPGMGVPVPQPYNTASMYPNLMQPLRFNSGGVASLAQGGYPRRIGQISGPGTETSDDIPAMLSDGEFVMTARAVRGAGNGSRRAGAKKMYAMMHQLEQNAARG